MKQFLFIFSLTVNSLWGQTCKALFSYGAQFEKVQFFNQSKVNNAHYFWNFGDGTGANIINPSHDFPDNGVYLVTLYCEDTTSGCSDYFELWLSINRFSTDTCVPQISDSTYSQNNQDFYKLLDYSSNCTNHNRTYAALGVYNSSFNTFNLSYYPGNYLSSILYTKNNTARISYKTHPLNFKRSKNYTPCSANFEFTVLSEDTNGQLISFKAMNKNADTYKWYFTGFGNPIIRYTDTASIFYYGSIQSALPQSLPNIALITKDKDGCRDSLIQRLTIRKKAVTYIGLKEQTQTEFELNIVPNPVKDKFKLQFEQSISQIHKITITNTLGQIIYTLNEPNIDAEIDISFLTTGIYYLSAENNESKGVFKIVKE